MANQEHVDILKQGAEVWNRWQQAYQGVPLDLTEADLSKANLGRINFNDVDLRGANLSNANLGGADLRGSNLSRANLNNIILSNADLWDADISEVNLSNANLSKAHLGKAYLFKANLSGARLDGADLSSSYLWEANFHSASLSGAFFSNAYAESTIFADVDLSTVKGLETVKHRGPSTIGIDTIYLSRGNIPESFLRGAGVDDTFITYMRSLIGKPIEYNSCFISYSSKDREFAERLYADLQSRNVRCWYAPHDIKTGDRIRPRIYEQIWFNDKLLLIFSTSSVASEWVDYEVETALARERKEKRDILFPIRLDDAVEKSHESWASHVQSTRHIGDFTRWKEHDEYQKGLTWLLRDLKQDAATENTSLNLA